MRCLWRLSVVVIVLTLAPMQASWAECAWVLWASHDKAGLTTWAPLRGFETLERCDTQRAWLDEQQKPSAVRGADVAHVVCFPDTVDPRGPKGGAR